MSSSSSRSAGENASSYRGHAKGEAEDVLDILAADHRKVLKMFDQFKKLKEKKGNQRELQTLVENACAEVTIHVQVEEELVYPAVRKAIKEDDLMNEALVEHASARQLINELAAMQPGDALYEAKFTVLGEYLRHHIQEEEKEMFPKVQKSRLALEALGEEVMQRKEELREELGIAFEALGGEGGEQDMAGSHRSERRSVH
jgi:hemerythrin superfamily protein